MSLCANSFTAIYKDKQLVEELVVVVTCGFV